MKKHNWHAFWHEKLFEKHPQPHYQTRSKPGPFESVIAVAFQSVFYSEIYQNNIFFIFKKLFLTSAHQNNLKI